jgi:hypothetical protein
MKGIFEFEVSGVRRGFKFGTYAFYVASKETKLSLTDVFRGIGDKAKKEDPDPEVDPMVLLAVFYGAAVHYAKGNNHKVDFNDSHVSDWLDEIGLDKVNTMLSEGLEQYSPKNSNSPSEKGEKNLITQ